jgi:hypothetical protein
VLQRHTDLREVVRRNFYVVNFELGHLEAGARGKFDNKRGLGVIVVYGAVGPINGFYRRERDGDEIYFVRARLSREDAAAMSMFQDHDGEWCICPLNNADRRGNGFLRSVETDCSHLLHVRRWTELRSCEGGYETNSLLKMRGY